MFSAFYALINKKKKKKEEEKGDTLQRETCARGHAFSILGPVVRFCFIFSFFYLSFSRLRNASEALYASDRIVPCFRLATAVN